MKFDYWSGMALFITLLGTVANSQRKIQGFYIWIIANLMWIFITWNYQDAYLTLQYVVFLILNFYGIWQWKKKED